MRRHDLDPLSPLLGRGVVLAGLRFFAAAAISPVLSVTRPTFRRNPHGQFGYRSTGPDPILRSPPAMGGPGTISRSHVADIDRVARAPLRDVVACDQVVGPARNDDEGSVIGRRAAGDDGIRLREVVGELVDGSVGLCAELGRCPVSGTYDDDADVGEGVGAGRSIRWSWRANSIRSLTWVSQEPVQP